MPYPVLRELISLFDMVVRERSQIISPVNITNAIHFVQDFFLKIVTMVGGVLIKVPDSVM